MHRNDDAIMKPTLAIAFATLLAALPSPPAFANIAGSRVDHSCDLRLNVIDPDPAGVNLRSAPDAKTGKVIATLAPVGEWIEVHVVGQTGAWLLVDDADAIDDDAPEGMRNVFHGGGWVHASRLGISELQVGEGTVLRAAPTADADVVRRIATPDDEPADKRVLGCRGRYLQVDVGNDVSGWTDTFCTNERTTCS
jgi:hypothetical protein